jgi:hypothetical protein
MKFTKAIGWNILKLLLITMILRSIIQVFIWELTQGFKSFSLIRKIEYSFVISFGFNLPATIMFTFLFISSYFLFKKLVKITIFKTILISIFISFIMAIFWNLKDFYAFFSSNSMIDIFKIQKSNGYVFLNMFFSIMFFSVFYHFIVEEE